MEGQIMQGLLLRVPSRVGGTDKTGRSRISRGNKNPMPSEKGMGK